MIEAIENIKRMFKTCLMQTIYLADRINMHRVEDYTGIFDLENHKRCHQYIIDIFDAEEPSKIHYGSFNLEIITEINESSEQICKVTMYTQVYGLPYVLEFIDFDTALYDMIERRNKFSK